MSPSHSPGDGRLRRRGRDVVALLLDHGWFWRFVRSPLGTRLRAVPALRRPRRFVLRCLTRMRIQSDLDRLQTLRVRRRAELGSRSDPGSSITTRFVVLSEGRSGTTLLVDELDRRWIEIRCLREEFGRNRRSPDEPVTELIQRVYHHETGESIVGCKVFPGHLTESELAMLLTEPGMRIVHLQRRYDLRRYVSEKIARKTDLWQLTWRRRSPGLGERRITVDLDDLLKSITTSLNAHRVLDGIAPDLPRLKVWYEDLAADLDAELRRVATFLGAGPPANQDRPLLERQNPEPLRMLVTNFDEVIEALRANGLAHVIDPADLDDVAASTGPVRQTCWPTPLDEHLLHAALDPPEAAVTAYTDWLGAGGGWSDDPGAQRLLPLLHRNLRQAGKPDAITPLLRRTMVETAATSLRLERTLAGVLDRLAGDGVPTLVLKGAALGPLHYGDRRSRPMHDLDVLVRPEDLAAALDALRADGWEFLVLDPDTRIERLVPVRHSVALTRDGIELDLHWHSLTEAVGTTLDDDLWAAAVPLVVEGRTTRALAPADQILHAIVHGLHWNPVPTTRWIADAHVVITTAGDRLDWDRLAHLARDHRLGAPVRAGVAYLDRQFPGLVPTAGLAAVESVPVTRAEQRTFEHGTRRHGALGAGRTMWYRSRRRHPDRHGVGAITAFLHDVRAEYDLDHTRQVPGRLAREALRRRDRTQADAA